MNSVVVENISKSYGTIPALKDISFTIQPGETFGLIGPDGAGKSTLFKILTTVMKTGSGKATVAGLDTDTDYLAIRQKIGYMPGRFSLYQDLSVEENLKFFATIFKTTIEENYYLIKDIYDQLKPFSTRLAGKLSGGMKQKLALCCALIHKPEVLFLDEPTTGVDPVSRKEFWDMLKRLKQDGITIMVSTPYMDEAIKCDNIGLIQHGELIAISKPNEVNSRYKGKLIALKSSVTYPILVFLRNLKLVESCYAFGDSLHVNYQNNDLIEIEKALTNNGFTDFTISPIQPGIEDVFMQLLKEKSHE